MREIYIMMHEQRLNMIREHADIFPATLVNMFRYIFWRHPYNAAVQRQKRVTAILTLGNYAFLPLDGRTVL